MYGMLWPKPTGQVELSNELIHLLPGDISIVAGKEDDIVEELRAIFKEYLYMMHPKYAKGSGKSPFPSLQSANASIRVTLEMADGGNATFPTMEVCL